MSFYREHLFNDHWGEQAHLKPDNSLEIKMLAAGLSTGAGERGLAAIPGLGQAIRPTDIRSRLPVIIAGIPARHFWDAAMVEIALARGRVPNPNGNPLHGLLDYGLVHVIEQPAFTFDPRPDAPSQQRVVEGKHLRVRLVHPWAYESLWLPESLLGDDASQQRLADALFAASRHSDFELHFNKGLAGAPPDAIAAARDTCTNPAVLTAFTLVIAGDAEAGPVYPGIPGHEPSVDAGRESAKRVDQCMNELRAIAPNGGAYVSESNFFEKGFQQSYWGSNYPRLAEIKKKYDPDGLFVVHNGVGSEQWSADGFAKL